MRIVQAVCWYYPDSIGGIEVYVAALSKRLRLAGHEVFIAAPHIKNKQERNYDYEGLPVYRYPIPPHPNRKESQGLVFVRGTEYFHKWLRDIRPDSVHFQGMNVGLGIPEVIAAKSTGAKIFFTSHLGAVDNLCKRGTLMYMGKNVCGGIFRSDRCAACALKQRHIPKPLAGIIGAIPPSLGKVMRHIPFGIGTVLGMNYLVTLDQQKFRQLFLLADKFVVITQAAYNIAVSTGLSRGKIFLNRLGITQDKIARKLSPQESPVQKPVKIGYLGRFDAIKGVYDLAKAAASLSADIPFSLEFRGPAITYAQKHSLNKIRSIIGKDRRVNFASAVSHNGVFDILRGYDVLCCPSLCFEGGPTVALEAYAVGTPVIGARIGGMAEIITDKVNGRLFDPGGVQELAGVIKEIAQNPSGTIDVWRRNIPSVRTMAQIAEDYIKIYKI